MRFRRRPGWLVALAAGLLAAACGAGGGDDEGRVRVFAAASLIDVISEVGAAWEAEGQQPPVFNFAATSQLARQIEQGAEADVFVSADEAWMAQLVDDGLVDADSVRAVAGNALVLIAPAGAGFALGDDGMPGLGEALGGGRLALAEPAVPAGRYARAALEGTGAWTFVAHRTALAPDVRAVLRLVELGEAAAGVVYETDAVASRERVEIVARFPAWSHEPIVYPVGAVIGGDGKAFAAFLAGDRAAEVFAAHGFAVE